MHSRNNARTRASRPVRQLMLLVGAGVVVAAVARPAAAAGWSIQPVPTPAHSHETGLNAVSCASTRDCVAVGFQDRSVTNDPVPLVERWRGSNWSTEPTPTPGAPGWSGWLSSVSCPSTSACVAVGLAYSAESRPRPLVERWDGSSWSVERISRLGDAEALDGVSCASSTDCMAVGYGRSSVAAHWNGARWRAQDVEFGDPAGRPNALAGVSCTPGTCAAVGWDNVGLCGGDRSFYSVPILGSWTEQLWSLRRHPNLACANDAGDTGGYVMNAVSCTSPVACTAVGNGVSRWDGRRWSIQPAPIGADTLDGVSCTSTDACTAVGSGVYAWSGHRWSSVRIAFAGELTGVSCPSHALCVAVGSYIDNAGDHLLVASEG